MIQKELEYDFHDSIVVSCEQGKDNRFVLTLYLYEIYYPLKESVRIVFSGVFNYEKVSIYFNELQADCLEQDWNGNRVNFLKYDSKKISKDLDLYLFIDIDGFKPMTIHCKKVRIEKVSNKIKKND